jgi:hypothetical protein
MTCGTVPYVPASRCIEEARLVLARNIAAHDAGYAWLASDPARDARWPWVDHRKYCGNYAIQGVDQFQLLLHEGLTEDSRLLDVGCGALALGRFALSFLKPDRYVGLEPNTWAIRQGLLHETGLDILTIKRPRFLVRSDYAVRQVCDLTFDYIVAHSVFTHASLEHIQVALRALRDAMSSASVLLATVIVDDDTPSSSLAAWTYPLCVAHRRRDVDALARDIGLVPSWIARPYPLAVKYMANTGEMKTRPQSWLRLTREIP